MICSQQLLEDQEEEISEVEKTKRVVLSIYNSLAVDIKFTGETVEDFPSGRIPTLDTAIWLEKAAEEGQGGAVTQRIRYSFYEKPMISDKVMLRKTAMSWNSMRASPAQDGTRRLLNTDNTLPQADKVHIMEGYNRKLRNSGYSLEERTEILESAVMKYERIHSSSKKNGVPVHKSAKSTENQRNNKKIRTKFMWLKNKPDSEESREKYENNKKSVIQ